MKAGDIGILGKAGETTRGKTEGALWTGNRAAGASGGGTGASGGAMKKGGGDFLKGFQGSQGSRGRGRGREDEEREEHEL